MPLVVCKMSTEMDIAISALDPSDYVHLRAYSAHIYIYIYTPPV